MLCDDLGAGGPFNSSKRWALLGSNQPPPAPINIGGVRCSYLSLKFSQSMYAPGEEFVGPAGIEPATTCPDKYRGSQVLLSFIEFSQSMYAPGAAFVGPAGIEPATTLPGKYRGNNRRLPILKSLPENERVRAGA